MKSISIKQPWASMIAKGLKTIETRSWPANFRGQILIVASKSPVVTIETTNGPESLPVGKALCIVDLVECRKWDPRDAAAACCEPNPNLQTWSWILENVRPIEPFPVRGKLGLYEVDFDLIVPGKDID